MANWIAPGTILHGELVDLLPLEEKYFDELIAAAGEKKIWEHYVLDGSDPQRFLKTLKEALAFRERGFAYPFVIFHKQQKKIIGATRFMEIFPEHKKLEIGWTWLRPEYWASAINLECKLLLLTHAFEKLGAVRLQLKTDEKNIRSRKAILKIGATFEGILRHDMIRDNGTLRSSAYYSILAHEWKDVKARLTELFESKKSLQEK